MTRLCALVLLASGCIIQNPGGGGGGGGDDQTSHDVDQWNQLASQYDARRTPFLGTHVQELAAVDNQLFWLDTTAFDPTLDRYDDRDGSRLAYGFSIGDGNAYNYRASANLIVTADPTQSPVVYHAYDATSPAHELGATTLPKPPGAQWDAYAVDQGTVYIIDTSLAGETAVLRWVPGSDPTKITTLEQAGVQVGEFWDFDVSGSTMIFIESGRIWKLDLTTHHATWLMNKTEVSGTVDFHADGVMFETATGLMFFSYATNEIVDLTAKINANAFAINPTFAAAAHYQEGFARWAKFVLYIGNDGLFAYDMLHDTITPILLEPDRADLRVEYRYPVSLDDGTSFVTGLESTDGAVGADGPTYKLSLKTILAN